MTATPFYHRDYFDHTTLHPVGLAATAVLGAWLLLGSRGTAIVPLMIMACFVAPAQRIAIGSIDMTLLRLLVLAGAVRVIVRAEASAVRWGALDLCVLAWCVSGTLVYTLLWQDTSSFINQAGARIFDTFLAYAVIRCLIRGWEDIERAVAALAVISVPVACAFAFEQMTARNLFAFLGGVPEVTMIRNGRLRCQGAFSHPILAGVFWASVLPMIASLWWSPGGRRPLAAIGSACCLVIIAMCASSTPVSATILAAIAAGVFPLRRWMRAIQWLLVALAIILHFVREQPIWHLLARLDIVGGSTGYHRYFLLDQFIRQTDKWWLMGMKGQLHEWLFDITNQYVFEGIFGGMLTLLLFLAVIWLAFRGVGRVVRAEESHRPHLMMSWAIGVALFVHVTSFIAVSYFGQIKLLWAFHLAVVAALVEQQRRIAGVASEPGSLPGAVLDHPHPSVSVSPARFAGPVGVATGADAPSEGSWG